MSDSKVVSLVSAVETAAEKRDKEFRALIADFLEHRVEPDSTDKRNLAGFSVVLLHDSGGYSELTRFGGDTPTMARLHLALGAVQHKFQARIVNNELDLEIPKTDPDDDENEDKGEDDG